MNVIVLSANINVTYLLTSGYSNILVSPGLRRLSSSVSTSSALGQELQLIRVSEHLSSRPARRASSRGPRSWRKRTGSYRALLYLSPQSAHTTGNEGAGDGPEPCSCSQPICTLPEGPLMMESWSSHLCRSSAGVNLFSHQSVHCSSFC